MSRKEVIMGLNLISGCHRHKVKRFHFRAQESETIMPFYTRHERCMNANPNNVETKDDQYQAEPWMYDYPDDEEA